MDENISHLHQNESQYLYYSNNSIHMYDQSIVHVNTYQESSPDLSPSMNRTIDQSYHCPINWVQPYGRRRRQRTVFSPNTIQQLENIFIYNQYPDIQLRENLATQIGVSESRIQVWFKNRRTRARIAQRKLISSL